MRILHTKKKKAMKRTKRFFFATMAVEILKFLISDCCFYCVLINDNHKAKLICISRTYLNRSQQQVSILIFFLHIAIRLSSKKDYAKSGTNYLIC